MDMRYISSAEAETEILLHPKPILREAGIGHPFNALSDRQFECLLQDLALAGKGNPTSEFGFFDQVVLMQGVGERGRDCALIKGGKHVGIIQCKRYGGAITKPDAAREIIKFCLHSILDTSLMPVVKGFKYVFAVSSQFNEPAKQLLTGFSQRIELEKDLLAWTQELIGSYKALAGINAVQIQGVLLKTLKDIDVVPLEFNRLDTLLVGQTRLVSKYFEVRKVVDNAVIQSLLKEMSDLTTSFVGSDTRRVLDALSAVPKEQRIDMGLVSFWGYPKRFFKGLVATDRFKEVMLSLTSAKSSLDQMITSQITEWVYDELENRPDIRHAFSPLTLSAATPYIAGKLLEKWSRGVQGNMMSSLMARKTGVVGDVIGIRGRILRQGQDYLAGDFSSWTGDAELFTWKRQIAEHTYGGYADLKAMEVRFDEEWPRILPLLEEVVMVLEPDIPVDPTVVLRSTRWLDDPEHAKEIFTQAKNFDVSKRPKGDGDN